MSRLIMKNDWGYYSWKWDGETLDATVGGICTVEFPDGFPELIHYISIVSNEDVNDMGHRYSVESHKLLGKLTYHGLSVYVPLERCNVTDIKPNNGKKI